MTCAFFYVGFVVFILAMLALDLGVVAGRSRVVSLRAALAWSAWWIGLALLFNIAVYFIYEHHFMPMAYSGETALSGKHAALQFLTAYVVEECLSLDNIFVIAVIFGYFQVPLMYQHRALILGILGALVLRGIMIALGAYLLQKFGWFTYVFGGLLILTAIRLLVVREEEMELSRNPLVRLARRLYPVTPEFHGERFFSRLDGRRAITPLFLVLLLIASCDVLFAVDSIPAVFAVTQEPFLVFTSNVFAVLGWRSLYFALAALLHLFRYLKISLVFVLGYVGVKMVLSHLYPIPTVVSLAVVVGILSAGIVASIIVTRREKRAAPSTGGVESASFADCAWKQAKRSVVLVIGGSMVLVGIAMVVLPGPATVVIPAGLAVLGTEFVWARRLLKKAKEGAKGLAEGLRKTSTK